MEKTALITGATSGIGQAFANLLATKKYALLLVASNAERLKGEQKRLIMAYPEIRVEILCQDLCQENAAERVFDWTENLGLTVDLLINNAGFGMIGAAETLLAPRERQMHQILMTTPTMLCKKYLPQMYEKNSGCIVNVASTGAFQPGPYTASYYASKSYLYQYSLAVRIEAASKNVHVNVVCPGTTRTNFFNKAGKPTPLYAMSPEKMVKIAWRGIQKNKAVIVPGALNRILRWVPSVIKAYGVGWIKK